MGFFDFINSLFKKEQSGKSTNERSLSEDNDATVISIDDAHIAKNNNKANIADVYGKEVYSVNGEYCVLFDQGFEHNGKWNKGIIALFRGNELLFKKKVTRPHCCNVSSNGIICISDYMDTDKIEGKFLLFDSDGNQIFSKRTSAIVAENAISDNGEYAIFETYASQTGHSEQIFVIDIAEKKLISKFGKPTYIHEAFINPVEKRIRFKDNRGVVLETDFNGNHTNQTEYREMLINSGDTLEIIRYYQKNLSGTELLLCEEYLNSLISGLKNKQLCDAYGEDKLYRSIGECYEALNEYHKAIDNWEKALIINPKVGIQNRLNKLKMINKKLL